MTPKETEKCPKIRPYNERSILIELEPEISNLNLSKLLFLEDLIKRYYIKEKVEVIHAYNSLLIIYYNTIDKIFNEIIAVKELISVQYSAKTVDFNTWKIPVCYAEDFAPDLESLSIAKGISKEDIIGIHSGGSYQVFFIGFLPGFLYLGGLNDKLHTPRKSVPNLSVKKGSVAIGGQQTGIYPEDSPGGWHIIGSTPIILFEPQKPIPCFASAGDFIKFKSITKNDYLALEKEISDSAFNWETLKVND